MAISQPQPQYPPEMITTAAGSVGCSAEPTFRGYLSRMGGLRYQLNQLTDETRNLLGNIKGHEPMCPDPEEGGKTENKPSLIDGYENELSRMEEAINTLERDMTALREFI